MKKHGKCEKILHACGKQDGVAMVFVICIMAVLVMLSMALMLASSAMMNNAKKSRVQAQVKILAVTMADELNKDLTVTAPTDAMDGGIWHYVNETLLSGGWNYYEEGSHWGQGHDLESASRNFKVSGANIGDGQKLDSCSVFMYWERSNEDTYDDAELTMKVTCTVDDTDYTVTSVYNAKVEYKKNETNEEADVQTGENKQPDYILWILSERK